MTRATTTEPACAFSTAVGIDVGGARKGFHAVAITGGDYSAHLATKNAEQLVHWSRVTMRARVVAVDAPCRWSKDGRARPAERELMENKIWCFSTPTRQRALDYPGNHYGWMLRGEAVFRALEPTYPLCRELPVVDGRDTSIETFPHAIAWHVSQGRAVASRKREQREELLKRAGIDTSRLTNIDLIDAALGALVAYRIATGAPCVSYGEPDTGLILVPAFDPAVNEGA
ncbi:MAG: DUF429 domain-containing protein [Micropepsaceae bacterium]